MSQPFFYIPLLDLVARPFDSEGRLVRFALVDIIKNSKILKLIHFLFVCVISTLSLLSLLRN